VIAAGSGLVTGKAAGEAARAAARAAMAASGLDRAEMALVFVTADAYREGAELLASIAEVTGATSILGCSGAGVLTQAGEADGTPGVAVMVLATEGSPLFTPVLISGRDMLDDDTGAELAERASSTLARGGSLLIFPDPINLSPNPLLLGFAGELEPAPIIGGVAAGMPVFEVYGRQVVHGALAALAASTVPLVGVTQSCEPIGEPYTVTAAVGNVIHSIGGRSPVEVLREAMESVPDHEERVPRYGVFAGLAADLTKSPLERGDFLVRALAGLDRDTGWVSLPETVYVGQTIQFQIRDARTAHDDLEAMLARLRAQLGPRRPGFGLYVNCAGRGRELYGIPDHDVMLIRERLGDFPLIGFSGNGEFAPVGRENFFHTYTGVLALF
jgi:small ligand-binding sensory domain FIST